LELARGKEVREEQAGHFFYVVGTVHFEIKLYNDQRNAQVFNLFISLLLPPGYEVSAQALTPYPGDSNYAKVVHLPLKMG
jgi:hypothetical protein